VFSHLACADVPEHPLNASQLQAFLAWRAALLPGREGMRCSLGASWACLGLPASYHFDFVRAGAALYGAIPHHALRPVVELTAPVLETRRVDTGGAVGYGAAHAAARPLTVATLGLGYADGYPRALSGKGRVMLAGRAAPVIGRVSMDMLTVDITGLEDEAADAGTAQVYGDAYTVNDAAADAGTIGYEILTRLGGRIQWRHASQD
jgi:alanine racemase